MLFARPPALDVHPVELTELLNKIASELATECERRNVRLVLQLPDSPIKIVADAQQLTVAINALCTNALEAIGEDGTIEITLRENILQEIAKTPASITIEIMDTGSGITEQVRRHLFDPFFSGREAGRGLGFGLSKCWRIITDHGGTIVVNSEPDAGTVIGVELPVGQ